MHQELTPQGPNFGPFHFTINILRDTMYRKWKKSEMHRITLKWPWTLNSENTLYIHILKTYPQGLNFVRFCLGATVFEMQGCQKSEKNGKCTERPQNDIEHLTVKNTMYTLSTYPWCPILGPFLLYDQPFSRYNVVINRKCTEWPQNDIEHLTVNSILHALSIYRRGRHFGQIWCAFWAEMFETFTPMWSHVNEQEKNSSPKLKFHNCLDNFGRDPL